MPANAHNLFPTEQARSLKPPLSGEWLGKLMYLQDKSFPVFDVGNSYERFRRKVPIIHRPREQFILFHRFDLPYNSFESSGKRIFDVTLSLLFLVLLAPVMLLTAVLIMLDSHGSVLFSQVRTGQAGKRFRVYKFRSMYPNAEEGGPRWAAKNDPRVTRVGKFIRATRLDELPQLINVLKGDMSFIGPRPERPVFNDLLRGKIPFYDLRHAVKPGITGWVQVMHPYAASERDVCEKLQYDLYYIKNYSLLLDVTILFKTLRVVMMAQGR